MRNFACIILAFLFSLPAFCSQDKIKWLSQSYDFGTWKEIEGEKTGIARFVNEGDSPTSIVRVRTSCGCTGADYCREPVMPGDTAWVSFTYNPAGRPGQFEKTVKVYTGANSDLSIINIRGTVIGKPESLDERYPFIAGALRLAADSEDLGEIEQGKARHSFVQAYNQSTDTIVPQISGLVPALTIAPSSAKIAPGDFFSFGIFYDSRREGSTGPQSHTVTFSDGIGGEGIAYTLNAFVAPRIRNADAAALSDGARIEVTPRELEIPASSKKAVFRFRIKNEGTSRLTISRVYSEPENAAVVTKYPVNLDPGKSGVLEGYVIRDSFGGEAFGFPLHIHSNSAAFPDMTVRVCGKTKQ